MMIREIENLQAILPRVLTGIAGVGVIIVAAFLNRL
jgi:hypothetical protein